MAHRIKNLSRIIFLISLWWLAADGTLLAQSPNGDEYYRVLVLNAYNEGYLWTDHVTTGIESELAKSGLKYELYVEYMDTKRYPLAEQTPLLIAQYRQKYANFQPAVIIAVDNNALAFLLANRDTLFPGVPVVFCGINDFTDDLLQGQSGYTGVSEALNIAGTVELALSLHPNTQNIVVISDRTETGIKNMQTVDRVLTGYAGRFNISRFVDMSVDELQRSLAELPPDTVILMISFFYDRTGRYLSQPEFSTLITQFDHPVYTFQRQFMGHGVMGGMLLDGEDQGRSATAMAIEILRGKTPADLPIVRQSYTYPGFDYAVLQKFNIPLSKLPPQSRLFNEPQDVFYRYRSFVWATGIFVIFQSAIILALLANIQLRRQAQQALALRVTQLSTLNDIGKQIAAVQGIETTLAQTTRQVHQRFNYHHVGLFLLNADQTGMVMKAKAGSYEHLFAEGHQMRLGHGMVGWVGQNNQTLLANDVTAEPRYVNSFPGETEMITEAELTVPIRVDGKLAGVLDVQSPHRNGFDQNDVRVIEIIADQLGIAIQNSRLYDALKQELADRRVVETALRRSEERYRLLFSHAPVGILQFDRQGVILDCNDEFVNIIGSSREKLVGLSALTDLCDQVMIDTIKEALNGHISQYEGEYQSVTSSKTTPVRGLFSQITSADGVCIGGIGLIEDMTERRYLEAQLQQAQKLEALGLLTGGIAHDFNNLLTAINGFAEILSRKLPPQESSHAMAANILKSGQRAADLVKQLLAFSRKQVMRPQIVNLNLIVTEMETMLKRLVSENISLSFSLASDLPMIKVDPIQMEQVILNLVVNANDAMPRGGRLIIETNPVFLTEDYTSKHHPEIAPGDYVVLSISDTGIGMSQDILAHIFEPFFTTKSLGKGTGLGLATVFGIVKQSGGDILAYSEEGAGTTFKIYLPVVSETKVDPLLPAAGAGPRSGTETILLVEDDIRVRQFVQQMLGDHGYQVLVASDGHEALTLAVTHRSDIDLLLTDVILPGKSGREVADELRQMRPGLKVLFMSGYTDNVIAYHGILDEGIHFLQKPFTIVQLAEAVRNVLD